ncbi:coiled-coil domain containing 6-like protein [Monoraphidium neglectum]|uniref:Coiled-coil domain containing 6-like protein n=1 Tax=Monoraphidium neglectum TaxID=145388 RepID=A0A0D2MZJ5_9CHLO|nr:coiled-coil domain containing 6-like protein [Monoraphidium neglectum]KIZ05702.1 coiled-coil domain containing 6-like protein [Monoraphidium neglectum]|eukprot:XP_013904721.1 coiled-coil domain containing 6-like protein [Monoraphidium neglectum]
MTELLYVEEYSSLDRDDLLKTACRLRNQLEQERKRSNSLAESLKLAKEQSLAAQKQVEQEEEFITNKLMKRLEQLKREKQALANEVEQEEEMITNTLQKKLEKVAQLASEKAALQRERSELQRHVGDLVGAVDRLNRDKVALEQSMEAEEENIVNRLQVRQC